MNAARITGLLSVAVAAIVMTAGCDAPARSSSPVAETCPEIEVVFARGTDEAPGVGAVGQAFVDALKLRVGARSVGVYAVDYPASHDFSKAAEGADDASEHITEMAAKCPGTKMVLGGFSQGALVMSLVTSAPVPMYGFTKPLGPRLADHVAAVAVFGNPVNKLAGGPLTKISPLYGPKAMDLCLQADPICSEGGNIEIHGMYKQFGLINKAATFAADRLWP